MKKAFYLVSLLIVAISIYSAVSCFTIDSTMASVKDIALTYEGNLVKYGEIGYWQYNSEPFSVPEGENPENFKVPIDEPLGEVESAEIDYYFSLDKTILYQVYNSGNAIYIAEYGLDGMIIQVDGWGY